MTKPRVSAASEYAALGRALRGLRHEAGLTQAQAAEIVGIRSTFVSLIERGERGMRWHTLLAFLRAYGADLHRLADVLGESHKR
ncbi:MAG TPA: helix-turn-helix transcriptional regulator [Solirubrobacteraceae bacterium]|nr:helix-turn-helix transcriptional regulator [Solirubrobacteraceae bacterium]